MTTSSWIENKLQVIREDGERILCRGRRNGADGVSNAVLVVVPAAEHPTPVIINYLTHEYELRGELDSAWAARPLELVHERGRTTLVLEDPGGEPLDQLIGARVETGRFLRLAAAISAALSRVHERGLIHKDIKPANVLVNSATDQVWLMGFGIASRLPRERQSPEPPEIIAGTLAYMAPEQTGRMNRSIDSRSDLYALGITFFEVLTGALPFAASDPMEWVHCHIAREPPRERMNDVPPAVSAIVMKLLAKTAEDRYQTAVGVESDLQHCLSEWEALGRIESFPLGAQNASDRLLIPEKLYGREPEIEDLVAAFDRVVTEGITEIVLISGYSGIGKSSVVNELHKVLVPPRGLFASGKFDQYKRDVPYATLAQAFQSLVRQLLSKNDEEISRWRRILLDAVGTNGQLMVNLIPELALIIGEQPPVPELPPQEGQNRFQRVFRRFLGVFAQPEHPLALFLDDLQWLDAATLAMLEHLATHSEVRHLLLVGAYRDNEVGPSHPLRRILGTIRGAGGRVQETVLAPLTRDAVEQMTADSLHCDRVSARPLGLLIHEKTEGNPFFAIQFFMELSEEGLLRFDRGTAAWTWDVSRIHAKEFSENVVDLMAVKIGRLSVITRQALGQLACLGNNAQIATMALVHGESQDRVHAALRQAVLAGLILRVDAAYKFLHDRVHEAAYGLTPESERAALHLRIGRALATGTMPDTLEDAIFDIVNHLNRGVALIEAQDERERVIALNLIAGKRARSSTAYASARNYLVQATALLSPDAWTRRYEETFELYLLLSECEYLVGNFEAADALFEMLLGRASSDLLRVKVHCLRIKLYQVAGKYDQGLAVALNALRAFGVAFPDSEQDIKTAIDVQLRHVPINLGGRAISELLEAPVAADYVKRAIIDLLVDAVPCAYIARPPLFPLVTLEAVNRSMRDGSTDQSSYVYGVFALMLVSLVGDISSAYQFSEMSLRLNERFNNARLRGTLLHLHGDHVNFWRRHFATGLPILERAFAACLEVGDLVYAGFLAFETVWQLIEKGDVLADVLSSSTKYATFAQQSRNDAVYETIRLEQRFVASLQGRTKDPLTFDDGTFDEAACFAVIANAAFGCGIVFYHIMKQILAVLYGRYTEAMSAAEQAEPVLGAAMAMPIEATYHFCHALTLTALYPAASTVEQAQYRRLLDEKARKLQIWAEHSPENYHNRYALVFAEIARIEARDVDAMRFYEQAIRSAHANGFVQNEALANELAGRFYAARGFEKIAHTYLRDARYCYLRWGATGKVRQLDELYPNVRERTPTPSATSTIGASVEHLDLAAIVKLSQAVSAEMVPEKLIDTLMRTAIEHAGAERGLLILPRGAELWIEAEAATGVDGVKVSLQHLPAAYPQLPETVLRYVARTHDSILLNDGSEQNPYSDDEYIREKRSRSILCAPLIKQAALTGVLYLENGKTSHVFTPARVTVLKLLASQAAISLENARLYAELVNENAERKKAEEALRASEASLAEGQRISSMGSWRWTVQTGAVQASAECLRILAIDPDNETLTFEKYLERVHPEDRPAVEQILGLASREKSVFRYENRIVLPNRSVRHVQSTGHPDVGAAGEIEFVGTVMDITERREAEEALRRSQVELARASRLSVMGELAGSIIHEINQPLAAVIGNAEVCLRWLDRPQPDLTEARNAIARLVGDGRRAADVVKGLRALAQKSGVRLTQVDISDAILEVITLLRGEVERGRIVLQLNLPRDQQPVLADRVQLQQVLINLIRNGIEAVGVITDRPRHLKVSVEPHGPDQAVVTVEDTGVGLDPTTSDRIFDPLFTTKPGGMGMGLSICRSIVEAHRGRLWVSSNFPHGTTFRFTVPLATDQK